MLVFCRLPPAVNIGMSAGKFEDLSTGQTSSIKDFFAASMSPAASQTQSPAAQTSNQRKGVKRKSGPLEGMFLNMEKTNREKILKREDHEMNGVMSETSPYENKNDAVEGRIDKKSSQSHVSAKQGKGKMGFFASIMQKKELEEKQKAVTLVENNRDSNDVSDFAVENNIYRLHDNTRENEVRTVVNRSKLTSSEAPKIHGECMNDLSNFDKSPVSTSFFQNFNGKWSNCSAHTKQNAQMNPKNSDGDIPSSSTLFGAGNSESHEENSTDSEYTFASSRDKSKNFCERTVDEVVHGHSHPVNGSDGPENRSDYPVNGSADNGTCSANVSPRYSPEDLMQCPKCGQTLPVWEMPEHSDFHFALEIQAQQSQNAPQRNATANGRTSSSSSSTSNKNVFESGKKRGRPKKDMPKSNSQSVLNFFGKK